MTADAHEPVNGGHAAPTVRPPQDVEREGQVVGSMLARCATFEPAVVVSAWFYNRSYARLVDRMRSSRWTYAVEVRGGRVIGRFDGLELDERELWLAERLAELAPVATVRDLEQLRDLARRRAIALVAVDLYEAAMYSCDISVALGRLAEVAP
jgi:hypothetical protein